MPGGRPRKKKYAFTAKGKFAPPARDDVDLDGERAEHLAYQADAEFTDTDQDSELTGRAADGTSERSTRRRKLQERWRGQKSIVSFFSPVPDLLPVPTTENKAKKNKNKRRLPQWAHEELKETAKRVREEHADPSGKGRQPEVQRATMEGKREDESMRQFNKRVREGTAQLLKDEFKEHSSTNKHRKKYLDGKKRKNRLKKQGLWEEVQRRERLDEEQAAAGFGGVERAAGATGGGGRHRGGGEGDGGGSNWGLLGRADGGEGTQLPQKERIRFGDVAHAPPDLAKIPKPRGFKGQGQAKPWARQAAANASANAGSGRGGGRGGGGDPMGNAAGSSGKQSQKHKPAAEEG